MDEGEVSRVAGCLHKARQHSNPISAPTKSWPSLTVDDAWRVQLSTVAKAVSNGDRVVGYKLGNIAKVMQDAFGLDQPDYGHLLGSTFAFEGTTIDRKQFIQPYVELEPAFVLRGHLKGPSVTVADVIGAIDYCLPAIEIIDSRIRNWEIDLPDTLADNGSTGAVILGGTPRQLTELNLANMRGSLSFEGKEVMSGNTSNILGNPIAAVAWLVNKLAAYGVEFKPGQIILPGSCLEAVPMEPAGRWSGTFEGFGTVEFDVANTVKAKL